MNTRIEQMNNKVYCAYCGKELQDIRYAAYPRQSLICTCEKAKRELELCDELKDLYNAPLADSVIDMKIEAYHDTLLGKNVMATSGGNASGSWHLVMPLSEFCTVTSR